MARESEASGKTPRARGASSRAPRDVLRGKVRAHDPFELIRWLAYSQPDPRKALDAEREFGMVGVRESLDVAKLFKTKSERWKYEREVRVIRPLEEADKVVLLENKEPRFSGSRLRNPSFAAGRFRRCAETPTSLRPRWIPTPAPLYVRTGIKGIDLGII